VVPASVEDPPPPPPPHAVNRQVTLAVIIHCLANEIIAAPYFAEAKPVDKKTLSAPV
jgi:hypothetical protein